MIEFLVGSIAEVDGYDVTVALSFKDDDSRIGYLVKMPNPPPIGEWGRIRIHEIFKENAHDLYGFSSLAERGMFRDLIRIKGIGPSVALALLAEKSFGEIMSATSPRELTVKGVGEATAAKIIAGLSKKAKPKPPQEPKPTGKKRPSKQKPKSSDSIPGDE
jgi:Holliday junction DNA helicase RuvA